MRQTSWTGAGARPVKAREAEDTTRYVPPSATRRARHAGRASTRPHNLGGNRTDIITRAALCGACCYAGGFREAPRNERLCAARGPHSHGRRRRRAAHSHAGSSQLPATSRSIAKQAAGPSRCGTMQPVRPTLSINQKAHLGHLRFERASANVFAFIDIR